MFYKIKYNQFYNAILDEICIEKDILLRLNKKLSFTPLRTIKSLPLIEKYRVSKYMYYIISMIIMLLLPAFFLVKMCRYIILYKSKPSINMSNKVVLVADNRIVHLYSKICKKNNDEITYININQPLNENYININNFLKVSDYLKVYLHSIISLFYVFIKLNNKSDILQVYVAYDWFKTYIALSRIADKIDEVYFSNHYDRWSVLFDQLLSDKKINLMQHGLLPDKLIIDYKLVNINRIFVFNQESEHLFERFVSCDNVNFENINLQLNLTLISSIKKTILLIGQPHSIDRELEIIGLIKDDYSIYVKPHPLYDDSKYKIDGVNLISDVNQFPKVNLALNYESTLGLEYEYSGIDVIWWKDMTNEEIISNIKSIVSV